MSAWKGDGWQPNGIESRGMGLEQTALIQAGAKLSKGEEEDDT